MELSATAAMRARELIENDPEFDRLYDEADQKTRDMTAHGRQHWRDVRSMGLQLVEEIERHFPGTFTPLEKVLYIPLACDGHDIGRSVGKEMIDGRRVDRHEVHGVPIMRRFMDKVGIPKLHQTPVLFGVVNHRANGVLGRNAFGDGVQSNNPWLEIKRRTLAVTVLADKCVGDSARVRGRQALKLRTVKTLGLSRYYFAKADENMRNNFANFAIQQAQLIVDPNDTYNTRYKGAIVLRLDLDERICTMEQILQVEWFAEAYHCCGKSAQALGFVFRIEANGDRWFWSKEAGGWAMRKGILVPRR